MIDQESADMLANKVWSEELSEMTADQLDELALLQWADDPDVQFDELGLSQDAGQWRHGVHTDEEMLVGPDGPLEEDL